MRAGTFAFFGLIIAVFLALSSIFIVDEREKAFLTFAKIHQFEIVLSQVANRITQGRPRLECFPLLKEHVRLRFLLFNAVRRLGKVGLDPHTVANEYHPLTNLRRAVVG